MRKKGQNNMSYLLRCLKGSSDQIGHICYFPLLIQRKFSRVSHDDGGWVKTTLLNVAV